MIDGVDIAGQCCVVALVITTGGIKVPVGLWLGDTENKTVVTSLLADLVERGLDFSQGILCVIDGAKALAAGVHKVFGEKARVQRCTLHKRRNLRDHLPKELGETIDKRLAVIFAQPDAQKGLEAARRLASELQADHPDAAASLREGLDRDPRHAWRRRAGERSQVNWIFGLRADKLAGRSGLLRGDPGPGPAGLIALR
jgi:transposase-like protein